MNRIHRDSARDVWSVHAVQPTLAEDPFGGEDFAALIFEGEPCNAAAWRSFVRSLMRRGARAVVYVGPEPEARRVEVEWTSHDRFPDLDIPPDATVVVTAFGVADIAAALEQLVARSDHSNFVARRFLVVCLGHDAQLAVRLDASVVAAFRGEALPFWPELAAPSVARPVRASPPAPAVAAPAVEPVIDPLPAVTPPDSSSCFLSAPGRWDLRGSVRHATAGTTPVRSTVTVSHAANAWTVTGRLGAVGCIWRVTPFASGATLTRWELVSGSPGRVDGQLVAVGDTLLSMFTSNAGAGRGCETYRPRADGGFDVTGCLVVDDAFDSSWSFELIPG